MTTLREQTDAKIAAGRKAKPEFMEGVDEIINEAKAKDLGNKAIQINQQAPHFELPNQEGKQILLDDLLAKGPVVITFYRGDWCPYCNLQLRALQARLNDIHQLGATLVAISPQVPDGSLTESEIAKMEFMVLSDQDAKIASEYGVTWKVPEFLLDHMRIDRQLDLVQINNGNGLILPIPATFVIGKDRLVKWSYVNVDYRTRSEPDDILKALEDIS
ncbi:peroxiredoxin-like family protein [Leeuwenhoekiella aequorea]|uniref:peroxiredoxin-like family protein n=1 Tax=Leeuwenhoekiella aequorea TaxID=283736 RepID=UPI00352D461E